MGIFYKRLNKEGAIAGMLAGLVVTSAYIIYFKFINMHSNTDNRIFGFQGSTNSGSSYGVTTTSTYFEAYHKEDDTNSGLAYNGSYDLAQSTNEISLSHSVDATNADSSCSVNFGYLILVQQPM